MWPDCPSTTSQRGTIPRSWPFTDDSTGWPIMMILIEMMGWDPYVSLIPLVLEVILPTSNHTCYWSTPWAHWSWNIYTDNMMGVAAGSPMSDDKPWKLIHLPNLRVCQGEQGAQNSQNKYFLHDNFCNNYTLKIWTMISNLPIIILLKISCQF